uniref:Uncharacterized protein LOC104250089 n=1 Tax=Nicotiana sylvestris TaxID=4096 RepID=A0A1U7Z222_NICSY|nr:PREDICTED: uncharacterized protein LOC104250089 [Nicotiana sylvestris]XP_009804940.1 PREDICTED: uncharacterized protein LOC104250089 [Nicotiana sylvestris]
MSDESEGSMTTGNTVIAPSEEASGEKKTKELGPLLTPFTGDEEVSSGEDDLSLSEVGKKPRKTSVKVTRPTVPTRKKVAPSAETLLREVKERLLMNKIIKELRGFKKPRKKVSVMEPVVMLDGEDEYESTLPEKSSTQKRKVAKVTKTVTPSTRASI